jgi:hypothetical protein
MQNQLWSAAIKEVPIEDINPGQTAHGLVSTRESVDEDAVLAVG